ncbi:MAG: HAD-IIA family hydrolase [Acidimicrobiales bacterium]
MDAFALDLDGVVWLADDPIPGAAAAVARLRAAGAPVAFVTNNSSVPVAEVAAKLARHGIDPGDDVVTSAQAAAALVAPGERALVCGGPGVVEALEARGAEVVRDGDADVVVVGFHRDFDYERLRVAATAVRRGARLLATNDDATYPTPDGPIPGGGAIVAAVATGSGVAPIVAGKPHEPMAALVRQRLGVPGVMVGDRLDTDGRFAGALGYRFALVLSGVTRADDLPVTPEPDLVAPDLSAVVDRLLG